MKISYKSFSIVAIFCIIIMQIFICFQIVIINQNISALRPDNREGQDFDLTEFSLPVLKDDDNEIVETSELPKVMCQVYITGAVQNPGVYEIEQGQRVADLIELAGGALENADLAIINLATLVEDARHVVIPSIGEAPSEMAEVFSADTSSITLPNGEVYEKPVYTGVVNINTANINELMTLPGIGETIARNIINYRQEHGPFETKEDIKNVSRIGDVLYSNISDMITI